MAINFLDNIQLNQNQILGARIENVTSDPSSANGGDIIFNSTSGKLKYYDGTSPFSAAGWISLPDGTGIGGSGTVGKIPVFNSTTEITDSRLETTGSGGTQSFLFKSTGDVASLGSFSLDSAGGIKDKDGDLGTSGQLLSSTGTQVNWIDAPVSYTKWVLTGDTGTQDINDGNTVLVAGGTNITTAVTATDTLTINSSTYNLVVGASIGGPDSQLTLNCSPGTNSSVGFSGTTNQVTVTAPGVGSTVTTFSLPTNVTIPGDLTVGGGDITLSGTGRIQGVDTVTAATDAANKQYVDNAVTGGFNVKGGFNANTGVTAVAGTNLYTNTAVAVGDYYVVTVAGNFFGQASTPLTPGDSVLAQTAAASGSASINNFAVIQSDTDLATSTTVGIGNVVSSANGTNLAGTKSTYSSGTATIGVDIKNTSVASSAIAEMEFLVYDGGDTDSNLALDINSLATFVGANTGREFSGTSSSGTSHVFTHNLGTDDVIVQIFDASTKETVYATVDRTSTNAVTVTTAASANIRCLITKIG